MSPNLLSCNVQQLAWLFVLNIADSDTYTLGSDNLYFKKCKYDQPVFLVTVIFSLYKGYSFITDVKGITVMFLVVNVF